LDLVPATVELCEAEARGRGAVAECLDAEIPASWPPPVFEPDDVARVRRQLEAEGGSGEWLLHYVLLRAVSSDQKPALVGVAGYTGPRTVEGEVEIGYAIAVEHQRRGYATEAVETLVARAFEDPRVVVVAAKTFPTLQPSIGVLVKTGFIRAGAEGADGTIRYERRRRS
jgi:RimJ/RimL family protein N-acetyltransferase